MPYAQSHYPFNEKYREEFHNKFPGDFIAEGLDQTRGMYLATDFNCNLCGSCANFHRMVLYPFNSWNTSVPNIPL